MKKGGKQGKARPSLIGNIHCRGKVKKRKTGVAREKTVGIWGKHGGKKDKGLFKISTDGKTNQEDGKGVMYGKKLSCAGVMQPSEGVKGDAPALQGGRMIGRRDIRRR